MDTDGRLSGSRHVRGCDRRIPNELSGAMTPGIQLPRAAHVPIDGFILALAGVVLAATLLPCRGGGAHAVHIAGIFAIAALFFLQGARLSRDAILNGMMHWRLHAASGTATF